jgi:hypothetical protein
MKQLCNDIETMLLHSLSANDLLHGRCREFTLVTVLLHDLA